MSNWGGEYQTLSPAQRTQLAQTLWGDTKFKVLRMWFNTNEFEPTPGARNLTQMKTNYLDSGIITDALAKGVTELLLAPEKMPPHMDGGEYVLDSQINNYAILIADGIKMIKDQYGVNITATGIQNEPNNTHQGALDAAFTPAQVVTCVKALRVALDARGLQSVKIIAPESGSADQYLWDSVDALKADSTAWNALWGISSHSYNIATNDLSGNRIAAPDGTNLKEYWQTEASDNGPEAFAMTGVPALRAASLSGRFLNDMNHRVTHWLHFIGFEKPDAGDNGTRIGYYNYPASNFSLTLLKKYYTYKQLGNAFDVGAVFRDSVSSLDGDMTWGWQKKPRVTAATAKNPDGSWTIGIQNFTADSFSGLQSGGDTWNSEQGGYTPAQSFNVTVKVTELQNTQPITFNITKTTGSVLAAASGTVTMTNGELTIPVNSLDTVTLRSGSITYNPTPTPTPVPTGKIRYWPRTPYGTRMQYGTFEGTNGDKITGPWTTLATLPNAATEGQWNEIPAPETLTYRYVRYRSGPGGYGNVAEIEFYSNGVKVTGTPYGSAPYAGGSNTFNKAFDNDTNSFFDANDSEGYCGLDLGAGNGAAPTVSLTSPTNGATFTPGSNISLAATASDSDGTVSKVEFYQGSTKLGEDLTSPYTYSWTGVAAGAYTLTARATDNSGNITASSPANITVAAANTPPTVSITSPTNGSTFTVGSTIPLAATASDSDGTVSKVEFYQGTTKLGEDLTSPYTYLWTGATAGTYSLTTKATDNSGATTTSSSVSITVSTASMGNGTGLKGEYFSTTALTPLVLTRTDATVNFDWGTGAAATSVGPDNFSVRWTGQVQAVETGTYTFSTYSDDGVRLWVNNVQLINNWTDHSPATDTGTISLTAGQKYNITLEYYESAGGALIQLGWLRPGQSSTVVIPQSQLYPPPAGAAPTVSLTSPTAGTVFAIGSTISLAATASDSDGTVSKVEFFQGTTKLGEDLTSPYTYSWTGATAGTYSLTAKATDNSGNTTTSSSVSIRVNAAPTASLTSPTNGATYTTGTAVSLAANASDSDGTISKVEFFQGTTKLGEDTSSPYTYSWTGAAAGTYSLTAKATDNNGAVTTSSAVSITISASNTPPTVSLTSPTNGATFTVGNAISLAATASDSNGTVTKVEFFQGTTKLGEDLTSPYTYSWTGATAGTYSLTARATDNAGATTTSAAVSIIVSSGSTTGTIKREVWTGVGGSVVSDIPLGTTPNIVDTLTSLEGPSDWADSYGTRISGYITAPTTGSYTFWIAGDDAGELWLSTDASAANKVKIAHFYQYTGSRNWNAYSVQKSATITLTAGQKYYVEVLHKEGAGGDSIGVGWLKPGQTGTVPSEVIPGSVLSPP